MIDAILFQIIRETSVGTRNDKVTNKYQVAFWTNNINSKITFYAKLLSPVFTLLLANKNQIKRSLYW